MADSTSEDPGIFTRVFQQFPINVVSADETMREHVRSALGRRLPEVGRFRPHNRTMAIAGGGPSLEDTWKELEGDIVAINASLGFLLERDVKPWAVGCVHPERHIADLLEPRKDIFYFIASVCHPDVFEKLRDCTVILWHPLGMPGIEDMVAPRTCIGGGSTMGVRWLTLGHYMGFRDFHCHGLDSSFRNGKTHAYPDFRDGIMEGLLEQGYRTSLNFMAQVDDWFRTLAMFDQLPPEDRITTRLFGDGLLQHIHHQKQKEKAA